MTTATEMLFTTQISAPSTPIPTLGIGSTKISEKDEMTMVFVPAGEFVMGIDTTKLLKECQKNFSFCPMPENENPPHSVHLDSFWIDETEVTNKMYAICVQAGVCQPPRYTTSYSRKEYFGTYEFAYHPVIYVDWNQANTYCKWAGRRLPSEAEWEKAARGIDERSYPWGNSLNNIAIHYYILGNPLINCSLVNYDSFNARSCVGDTTIVGNYPSGRSPFGLFDMAGNVAEWVLDFYDESYYSNTPRTNPLGPTSGQYHVVRGGGWSDSESGIRVTSRWGISLDDEFDYYYFGRNLGFRCALSAE